YGITRRGYGASSCPKTGYTEERLTADDLQVFQALKLVAPVVAGHSVAGNELSTLGIHHADKTGGLIYLEALNDGSDDWSDLDALQAKLPESMKQPPPSSPDDKKSFAKYQDWRKRSDHVDIPEAEWRTHYAENPDGSVGARLTPEFVSDAIMDGNHKHD